MKLALAFSLGCVALFFGISTYLALPAYTPLTKAERAKLHDAIFKHESFSLDVPVVFTWWTSGKPIHRIEAKNLDEAVRQIAAPIDGTLSIDLIRGEAPLPSLVDRAPWLFAFSIVPGVDGLILESDDKRALLLPDDLQRADALAAQAPSGQLDLELGLDVARVLQLALDRINLSAGDFETRPHRWRRVRTERFVERKGELIPVARGHLDEAPSVTVDSLNRGAREGGDYLVRHLGPDGRFDYVYDPITDQIENSGYSLPRHAGATSFLAQLHGAQKDPRVAEATVRALQFLVDRAVAPRGSVGEGSTHDLGGSALSLVAAAHYRKASGDHRFDSFIKGLADFILFMQAPDGDFRHLYRPAEDKRDEEYRAPYYSGEATLGLALVADDDPRYAAAADRALDYLTGKQYDFFVGQFLYAEDHWTCMAADALWDHLSPDHRVRYTKFCRGFADFLRRMQYSSDEAMVAHQPELAGSYGFGPILAPHDTPTGSRSECTISVWRMCRRLGWPSDDLRDQILASMQFLLARQLRDDQLWLAPDPARARGGIPLSDVKPMVRIDSVQHACLALLRATELVSVLH
jgi:hypothetical protein